MAPLALEKKIDKGLIWFEKPFNGVMHFTKAIVFNAMGKLLNDNQMTMLDFAIS